MKIWFNILPNASLSKGGFKLHKSKFKTYAASLKRFIQASPTGIPLLLGHTEESPEYGYFDDVRADKDGIWMRAHVTDRDMARAILEKKFRRVSAHLVKNLQAWDEKQYDLAVGHVALVSFPQFTGQQPPKMETQGGLTALLDNSRGTSMTIEDKIRVEEALEERREEELEEREEELEASDVELLQAAVADLQARVAALEAAGAALESDDDEEELEEREEDDLERDEDDEEELSFLRAENSVLRDTQGKSLGVWTVENLVEARLGAPRTYQNIISQLRHADSTSAGVPRRVRSRVMGAPVSVKLSHEEALKVAEKALEDGGDVLDAYRRAISG